MDNVLSLMVPVTSLLQTTCQTHDNKSDVPQLQVQNSASSNVAIAKDKILRMHVKYAMGTSGKLSKGLACQI